MVCRGDGVGMGKATESSANPLKTMSGLVAKSTAPIRRRVVLCPIWKYTGSKGLSAQTTRITTSVYISCGLLQQIYLHVVQCMSHVRARPANN